MYISICKQDVLLYISRNPASIIVMCEAKIYMSLENNPRYCGGHPDILSGVVPSIFEVLDLSNVCMCIQS